MSKAGKRQNFSTHWHTGILRRSDLDSETRLVASVLYSYMDASGGNCVPSIGTIAENAAMSKSTVERRLRLLKERGYLEIVLRGGMRFQGERGAKYTNLYVPLPLTATSLLTPQSMPTDTSESLTDTSERSTDTSPVTYNQPSKNSPIEPEVQEALSNERAIDTVEAGFRNQTYPTHPFTTLSPQTVIDVPW